MHRLLGAAVLIILLTISAACSLGISEKRDHIGEKSRQQSTSSPEKTVVPPETTSDDGAAG